MLRPITSEAFYQEGRERERKASNRALLILVDIIATIIAGLLFAAWMTK